MHRTRLLLVALALVAASQRAAQGQSHAGHAHESSAPPESSATVVRDPRLPADELQAKQALERSPRHGEFVDIPFADSSLRAYVVYPERRGKAGVVVIIHEIFGLSDWIRAVADQLASDGFIAVAPDLISGLGPGGGGTEALTSRDDVVKLVRALGPERASARLAAVDAWSTALPSANGRVATIGFCWGGSRSFEYAATRAGLRGAVVYYGTSPDSASVARLHAPVLGFYGADDARVTTTVAPAERAAKAAQRTFEAHVYDGAGHGFLRQQLGRDGANQRATQAAWPRTIAFLRDRLDAKR